MDILNLIKKKKDVLKFLLQTIESNDKMAKGLRNMNTPNHLKVEKLTEVMANQCIQIKHLSILLLCYSQGSNFDADVAKMMNKMGRGDEALKQMFKNKMNGL